jgi:hypothetical protein
MATMQGLTWKALIRYHMLFVIRLATSAQPSAGRSRYMPCPKSA